MSQGRERHRARNTLVVVQVALALVLLIGSGLMIRTFQALHSVQPGFTHPERVQLLRIAIPDTQVKEPERVMRMENDMIDKLVAIPGVESASLGVALRSKVLEAMTCSTLATKRTRRARFRLFAHFATLRPASSKLTARS